MYEIVYRVVDGSTVHAYGVSYNGGPAYSMAADEVVALAQSKMVLDVTASGGQLTGINGFHIRGVPVCSIKSTTRPGADHHVINKLVIESGIEGGRKVYTLVGTTVTRGNTTILTANHGSIGSTRNTSTGLVEYQTKISEDQLGKWDAVIIGKYTDYESRTVEISRVPAQDNECTTVDPKLRELLRVYQESGVLRPLEVLHRLSLYIEGRIAANIGYEIFNHGRTVQVAGITFNGFSSTMIVYSDVKEELGIALIASQSPICYSLAKDMYIPVKPGTPGSTSIDVRDDNLNIKPEFSSIRAKIETSIRAVEARRARVLLSDMAVQAEEKAKANTREALKSGRITGLFSKK